MSTPMASIPQTAFALISGSAGWGIKFPDDLSEPGVCVLDRQMTFDTPWGPTSNWQLIELDASITADGRSRQVLNVFSHGMPIDTVEHSVVRRVGWVLGQAGARKVLADSTCGSLNRALQPADFIVPADVIDLSQTTYSSLPGRFKYMCRGAQLFCPSLASIIEDTAKELWEKPGRVYGHASHLVVAHTWGPRFETPSEARALALLGADLVNNSIAADATLSREIGACFASATYVTNFVDGVVPGQWGDMEASHARLGRIAPRISLRSLARLTLETDCGCSDYRTARPHSYSDL